MEKKDRKRAFAAFYTPQDIIERVTHWAIRDSADTVLEPSFGGCGFLDSSYRRLASLGGNAPESQIFGCDIDSAAFCHLRRLKFVVPPSHFKELDFLRCNQSTFPIPKFSTVVGNPPFLRVAEMSSAQRESAARVMFDAKLGGRHSLWSLFLVHAIQFVAENGRMAWVLPNAVLFTRYGKELIEYLGSYFARLEIETQERRAFRDQGTAQEVVVLFASGHRPNRKNLATPKSMRHANASTAQAIRFEPHYKQRCRADFTSLIKYSNDLTVGSLCKVSTGIVTGNNADFLMTSKDAGSAGIQRRYLTPIAPNGRRIPGLTWSATDQERFQASNGPAYLLSTGQAPGSSGALRDYLLEIRDRNIERPYIMRRPIWHRINSGPRCHAFVVCMNKFGPRIVVNETEAFCTNSLHRMTFEHESNFHQAAFLSILMMSAWGRLWSELNGRSHTGNFIKVEPKEFESMPVLTKRNWSRRQFRRKLSAVDLALRNGNQRTAEQISDEFIRDLIPRSANSTWSKCVTAARTLRRSRLLGRE